MTLFPLPLSEIFGHWGSYAVYLVIGIAFGAVLEMAGFGNSRKLAAQFYFQDMTVLKVMFTAIIVAMVLVFGATAVGLLDYNLDLGQSNLSLAGNRWRVDYGCRLYHRRFLSGHFVSGYGHT